ncbi:MAG: hypothetical protein JWP35_4758 [Caulobacter sp.]|nr:hypothetical protein [Caulobacter sp.]
MARQASNSGSGGLLGDLFTFNRLYSGSVIRYVYWAGLAVVTLMAFGVVGAAVGLALKEPGIGSILLALPTLVAGLLVVFACALLWRSFCEFYVVIFRISDDLRALRQASDADHAIKPPGTRQV